MEGLLFNKGRVFNAAVAEILARVPDTACILMHDVDLIPMVPCPFSFPFLNLSPSPERPQRLPLRRPQPPPSFPGRGRISLPVGFLPSLPLGQKKGGG